jgi:hypothetical protein
MFTAVMPQISLFLFSFSWIFPCFPSFSHEVGRDELEDDDDVLNV